MIIPVFVVFVGLLHGIAAHTVGTDAVYFFESYLTRGICGPQTINGFITTIEENYPAGSTTLNATRSFNGQSFTPPIDGIYHCCASFRLNSLADITMVQNNDFNVVAGLGTRGATWSSHSVCVNLKLTPTDSLYLKLNSGGSGDCIEETNYRYGHFNCFLYYASV